MPGQLCIRLCWAHGGSVGHSWPLGQTDWGMAHGPSWTSGAPKEPGWGCLYVSNTPYPSGQGTRSAWGSTGSRCSGKPTLSRQKDSSGTWAGL